MNQSLIDAARKAGIPDADIESLCEHHPEALEAFDAIIRRQERERCAKVCDDPSMIGMSAEDCAAAIRAMED